MLTDKDTLIKQLDQCSRQVQLLTKQLNQSVSADSILSLSESLWPDAAEHIIMNDPTYPPVKPGTPPIYIAGEMDKSEPIRTKIAISMLCVAVLLLILQNWQNHTDIKRLSNELDSILSATSDELLELRQVQNVHEVRLNDIEKTRSIYERKEGL